MDNKFEATGNTEQNNNSNGWESVAAMANGSGFQPEAPTSETTIQPETVPQPEKILTADNNVYREIAKNALKNWNGLTEEDATEKTTNLTEQELEENVGARSSIKSAIYGIYGALAERGIVNGDNRVYDEGFGFDISEIKAGERETYFAVFRREKGDEAFKNLAEKLEMVEDKEKFTLDVLSNIHNDWVEGNVAKLRDPSRKNKRYQAMPLELIGFDEAKSDLLFLEPILNASGMEVNEERLKEAYDTYGDADSLRFKELAKNPQAVSELENWQSTSIYSEHHKNVPELAMITGDFCEALCNKDRGGSYLPPIDYSNIEDTSKVTGIERIAVPKKYVEDVNYYRDHYGTYEEAVRDRDKAALDASRGYTEKFVDREPGEGEKRERYWVEVAKQLVAKVGNVSSENE